MFTDIFNMGWISYISYLIIPFIVGISNVGGIGGASYFGSSDVTNTGSDTVTVYGAGGWGADGALDANGATGASGIVIVTEYK